MFRNKENIPLQASDRQNGFSRSSSKYLPSDEFFTDSLLDATRLSDTRIPSPSPQKQSLQKARRARNSRNTRNAQTSNHRLSVPEDPVPRTRQKSLQPSTPQRNGSSLARLRTYSLSTPPGSTDDLPLASPYASISSPPPQDLTDTYRQIEDEDDLAQTERELSSDGGSNDVEAPQPQSLRLNLRSKSESPLKAPITLPISSAASTPTRSFSGLNRHKRLVDRTEALSEASGLSFLKEITDQGLADKLTPHVSEMAKDKARLKEMWDQRPIAFSKAQKPPRFEHRPDPSYPVQRVTAFSRATKPPPNIAVNGAQIYDTVNRPQSQHSGTGSQQSSNDTNQTGEQPQHMPIRAGIHRDFRFSSNYGFPPARSALTEKNLEQQNRGSPTTRQALRSQSSAQSLRSDRSGNDAKVLGQGISRIPQFRKSLPAGTKPMQEEQSQVDWAAAAAEIPVPSIETSLVSENNDAPPMSASKILSPEKSRRWDNDFTSHSFQVSESPPVRKQAIVKEHERQKEIEGVARHAVTTSRLSEIRERQSQESLRSMNRSPAPRSSSVPVEAKSDHVPVKDEEFELIAEPVPDTPIVIYRSSSNSGSDKTSLTHLLERPNMDRSKSHDHLQRLARAMSMTPKSSPDSAAVSKDVEDKPIPLAIKQDDIIESQREPENASMPNKRDTLPLAVVQTPKMVGAWTDTILPDTIKTIKKTDNKVEPAQTPHISAGGWVDTPAPVEQRRYTGTIPTIVEEVPEELTAGFVKDTASSDTIKVEVEVPVVPAETQNLAPLQPKSALASILDQQKNRIISQDITAATQEDTLNLGNDTLESLQDLLDLDENDITTLSRLSVIEDDTRPLGEAQAEADLLERLGVKLDRLRNNVRDARKGISKLEHQVSQPVESVTLTTPQQLMSDTICQICNQQTFKPHMHPELKSRFLPHASLPLYLPVPILFRRPKSGQWFPRLTPIGVVTLILGLWYLVENTMCELYCRPAYTDFYVWPSEQEPEFPFVLPTMLGRWTRLDGGNDPFALKSGLVWVWRVLISMLRAVWRVIAMSVGWSDGFVADSTTAQTTATVVKSVVQTVATAAANSLGVDVSMNDDEYL